MEEARELASKSWRKKFFRVLSQGAGNCVIIQGFADRGEANEVR